MKCFIILNFFLAEQNERDRQFTTRSRNAKECNSRKWISSALLHPFILPSRCIRFVNFLIWTVQWQRISIIWKLLDARCHYVIHCSNAVHLRFVCLMSYLHHQCTTMFLFWAFMNICKCLHVKLNLMQLLTQIISKHICSCKWHCFSFMICSVIASHLVTHPRSSH